MQMFMQELLNRLKNRVTLGMVLSVVFGILVNLGLIDLDFVRNNQDLINFVIGVLSVCGVLRNPYGEKPRQ